MSAKAFNNQENRKTSPSVNTNVAYLTKDGKLNYCTTGPLLELPIDFMAFAILDKSKNFHDYRQENYCLSKALS